MTMPDSIGGRPFVAGPTAALVQAVRSMALPLAADAAADLDPVLALIGDATVVLLGEGTCGTQEFADLRQRLTCSLIQEKGFRLLAIDTGAPIAARLDQYVTGAGLTGTGTAKAPRPEWAAGGAGGFPAWRWQSSSMQEFAAWLRDFNATLPSGEAPVRCLGLDRYDVEAAAAAIVAALDRTDPDLGYLARRQLAACEPLATTMHLYARLLHSADLSACEPAVQAALDVATAAAPAAARRAGAGSVPAVATMAGSDREAERFYRALLRGDAEAWNARDRATFETLARALAEAAPGTRAVIWAHNTHVGDFRMTDQEAEGYVNLGQLCREHYPQQTCLLGFGTYMGTVTAAPAWGEPAQTLALAPSLPGSFEHLLHLVGQGGTFLPMATIRREPEAAAFHRRLQRAIGAVYDAGEESYGGYYQGNLVHQFDGYLFMDQTRALGLA
jgi:erythromycin esterase-like protein